MRFEKPAFKARYEKYAYLHITNYALEYFFSKRRVNAGSGNV